MAYTYHAPPVPRAFIWKRLHSLTGLFLVLFLIEHLLTNSQAALFVGENGAGFIQAVNFLQDLPYLPVLEWLLLGVPFLIHGILGVRYIFTGKYNSFPTDDTEPSLGQYPRNQAYTWQRLTAWVILVGTILHVFHMRILSYPSSAQIDTHHYFITRVSQDPGLYTLSKRVGFDLYSQDQVQNLIQPLMDEQAPLTLDTPQGLIAIQQWEEKQHLAKVIQEHPLHTHQLLAITPNFGMALLLIVRDTFKSPIMIFLYTVFLLATTFHAFNGLWTGMMSWGITLTATSQRIMRRISTFLLILISFLGLASIWGSYWFNLIK